TASSTVATLLIPTRGEFAMSSRLSRHLVWEPAERQVIETLIPRAAFVKTAAAPIGTENLKIDGCFTPRDTAIYLLHVGSEIEHMLMVQYLYAGFSLGGSHLDQKQN